MAINSSLIPAERIERRILLLRGQRVMLDFDLAELYGVPAKVLNQSVKRNIQRFPHDFMFQLSEAETLLVMRSQFVTSFDANPSKSTEAPPLNWSQNVTTSARKRRLSHRPYAFTEQGVAMLSSVLRSPRAVLVNVAIMRAFVQLRQLLATHADLAKKLAALEDKYDENFKVVFDAIRELMTKPEPLKPEHGREIGFHSRLKPRAGAAGKRRKVLA